MQIQYSSEAKLFSFSDRQGKQPAQHTFCEEILCTMVIATCLFASPTLTAAESTPRRNSINLPAEPLFNENVFVIKPSSTNYIPQDAPFIGPTNITELELMLRLYTDATAKTIVWPKNLSIGKSDFTTVRSLTRRETARALDACFALSGIGLIDVGQNLAKPVAKAVPSAGCQTAGDSADQSNYLVHVQQLTYLKPSELVPILAPFASNVANPILPIDSEQILVLRDAPDHLQRMKQVIRELDVATPIEYLSEVIPVKYAKASEIAVALHKSGLPARNHRSAPENIVPLGQNKIIADERTNSLLVYAGREEMKRVKEMISELDIRAAQILLEAVIIEVNRTDKSNLSIIDDGTVSWTTNFVSVPSTNAPSQSASTPSKVTEAGFHRFASIGNDLDSLVSMLATNTSAKILQRPRIQTSDGVPAQLFIGESRPYPSESYTCGSSIQAVNEGVTLELTPSITNNNLVALDIHQTIEEANGSVSIANVGDVPITRRTERSAKTVVSDRSILVLDSFLEQTNASPRPSKFKRILTLNGLLHHSKPATNQYEFIVLLRPTILPAPEVAQLSKAEKDKMPGVRRAEREVQTEEAKRLKQLEKNLKDDRDLGTN